MPKVPVVSSPKLTNRGPAGLLAKLPTGAEKLRDKIKMPTVDRSQINKIAPDLEALIVDIDSVLPDPDNARLHPERNMEAIKDSLSLYGQTTAIVGRTSNRVIMAGNGRLEAAKQLGWTKIAVSFNDMDDAMAAGYGLADNRTAELAAWDMEVVHRLDKLYQDAEGFGAVGWSLDELTVLRTDWESFTGMLPNVGDVIPEVETEIEKAPGDAELLMKLKVTIEEPKTIVSYGEVYKVGQHTLVISDVIDDWARWKDYLEPGILFCPFPGPLVFLTSKADKGVILAVQRDPYIAGHILDNYKNAFGDTEVVIIDDGSEVRVVEEAA